MAKHRRQAPQANDPTAQPKAATLKDLLSSDVLTKLKTQADELKSLEAERKATELKQKEEARKAEKKRLENDFEYLLANDKTDWRKFK
ncbi:YqkE family protein [Paenibacillus aquistagni]|uniref:DUF3886 domain-containing protein n=1 Tax=Paenibacillus aquistagni TaxID=1852522 RepID=A0A1X7JNN6_9BACL|nr:YqkE family protein [Paenibacillus aquistagni]NMM54397.1 YqkE family protein [Paenibacillus aquistagni]SMG29276.1 Protein of unknown function [Paenibacillus aquistagni]